MKKRNVHPKSVLYTVMAVVLSVCLVCSVPVVTADALQSVDSFDNFRLDLFTTSGDENLLYLPDTNQLPCKTILARNSYSQDVIQWQGQYADTSSKRIAMMEGYLYDICERAYSASVSDPFILKSVQARQACWLETIAQLKNVNAATYAAVNIAGMTNSEYETFCGHLSRCNGFPEHIYSIIMDFRTLNATVEEFLYAVAVIDELYGSLEEIGTVIHHAGSQSQDPEFEAASLRIEQYTDFARGDYSFYKPLIQSIISDPNFDPTIHGTVLIGRLWGDICLDLNTEQIAAASNAKGMFGQTAVSADSLLDNYNEMRVLADFHDALKAVTYSESNSTATLPRETLLFPAFKTLLASGAFINELTVDYANNAGGSGMFISVVEGNAVKELEFLNRLIRISAVFSHLNKGIDRVHFNDYINTICSDAANYLNIQPEPSGAYDTFETEISALVNEITTLGYTTGDVTISNTTVFEEDYDFFGDLVIGDDLTIFQCNPIVEGSISQTDGILELTDGSLTVYGYYEIIGQGVLHMLDPNDIVKVYEKFSMTSNVSHAGCLLNGILYVGGNFVQSGNTCSFQTSGDHKTILFGNTTQHVHFDSTDSGFTQLELQNDDIMFDSALRSLTLYCDLTVSNDWNWQANDLNLSGYTLNVNGNFTVSDGEVQLNDGELNISGNLNITGTGALPMLTPMDRVNVGGNFSTDTTISHGGRLTDGVMTVKGDFTQMGDPQSFAASNNHTVVLNAPQPIQTVSFADPSSSFYRLRLMNDYPADYSFTPSVCWVYLETVTTVNEVYLRPRLQNLPRGTHTILNPGVRGKNLSSPSYTLSLSGSNSSGTVISNDTLYIGHETAPYVTVTITSTDDPSITASVRFAIPDFDQLSIGDINFDGGLTIQDATMLQENLAEMFDFLGAQLALSDFNNDGRVNIRDVTAIQRHLAELE